MGLPVLDDQIGEEHRAHVTSAVGPLPIGSTVRSPNQDSDVSRTLRHFRAPTAGFLVA